MLVKEYSLSKKEGWPEYEKRTWVLLPKFFNSDLFSYMFWALFFYTSYFVYSNGGIEDRGERTIVSGAKIKLNG